MKSEWTKVGWALVILVGLAGCSSPTGSSDKPANPLAVYAGNWALPLDSMTVANQLTLDASGTWTTSATQSFTISGTIMNYESDSRGTLAVNGDLLTLTTTQSRGSTTAFADGNTGWTDLKVPSFVTQRCFVSGGRLYGYGNETVYRAQGDVSGIVATWLFEHSGSDDTPPYTKSTIQINSDGTFIGTHYSGTDAVFTGVTPTTTSGTFTTSNGTVTIDETSPTVQTISLRYLVVGNYLVMGATTATGLGVPRL